MSKTVEFTRDYDHPVRFGVDLAYKAGCTLSIPEAHAEAAVKAGAGRIVQDARETAAEPAEPRSGRANKGG